LHQQRPLSHPKPDLKRQQAHHEAAPRRKDLARTRPFGNQETNLFTNRSINLQNLPTLHGLNRRNGRERQWTMRQWQWVSLSDAAFSPPWI
jgi:hypothetical protein